MSDDVLADPVLRTGGRRLQTTEPLGRGLVPAGILAAVFALFTYIVQGRSGHRIDLVLDRNYHVQHDAAILHMLDRIGQRAFCLPILAVLVAVMVWRHRSARPALVAAAAVFGINVVVLILKVWLGRGAPLQHQPQFWIGGQMYPSGHTSNIIVVYGMCVYLLSHYGFVSLRTRRLLIGLVAVLGVIMTMTSLLLHWHWFTDLIGGFFIGGAVLALAVAVDRAVPFESRRLVVADPEEPVLAAPPPVEPVHGDGGPVPRQAEAPVSQRTAADSSPHAGGRPSGHSRPVGPRP